MQFVSIMKTQIPIYNILRNIASNGAEYEEEISEWLSGSEENRKVYDDLVNVWQITGSFPNRFSPNRSEAWHKVQNQIRNPKKRYLSVRKLVQIAAAVVIVFLSVWSGTRLDRLNQKTQYTEVISPAGQKTRIVLPDSSIVLLNSNSQIRYSQRFNIHDRRVELKGEGYFDIKKDLSRQFIVSTPELDIKVFGTSFNVKAYGDDRMVEVGLKKGKVGIDRDGKEIVKLIPGEMASLDKEENKIAVSKMDINMISAWTREEMIFNEESFEEIIKYIERWYGVSIQVSPELYDGERLTFKVKTESLNELLNLINLLKPIKYHIDGKQVVISKP